MAPTYILVSLPTSISPSNDHDEALAALRSTISTENGIVLPFKIPDFKIGTLDALVQQADDLAKLDISCEAVVARTGDSLRGILEGDADKVAQQKTVNDKPPEHYLRSFNWNKVRYRADKPLAELIDTLQKELVGIDNDIKGKFTQYNQVKTTLTSLQRKQTGNLITKSLTPLVDPSIMIQNSEYLETHLIVVPTTNKKDFLKSYETLAPMVVPRSSIEITNDAEYTLFAVTTFKKTSAEFLHKCRESKWTPRDYKYVEGGKEEERKELDRVQKDERKVWGESLRLGRINWGQSVMIWIHVFALRVFVETVLRYGLPLDFVCGLVITNSKLAKKVKANLDSSYSYLGGNAFHRDKKGKVTKDDSALSSEMAAAGVGSHGDGEYTAYVYYEFEIN